MRSKCFLFLVGLSLLDGSGTHQAPRPARPAKVPERTAPANLPTTLDERWKEFAGGAAVWRRADVTDPLQQFEFDLVAERVQSTNGEITKEQFLAMSRPAEGAHKDDAARKAAAPESPKAGERRPSPPAAANGATAAGEGRGSVAGAGAEFRRRDANQDGLRERMAPRVRAVGASDGGAVTLAKAAPAADLPPDLPDWFRQYDRDGDGQIGLHEWLAAGQPIARFKELDYNDDGFITPDEVLGPLLAAKAEKENKDLEKLAPEADPGSLTGYQDQIGKLFAFRVTGAANGGVWGSGVYTADSTLAVAAVHAGVLAVGKTGTVKVRIVAPPPSFTGSTANGVTTHPFGSFPGAYQIVK